MSKIKKSGKSLHEETKRQIANKLLKIAQNVSNKAMPDGNDSPEIFSFRDVSFEGKKAYLIGENLEEFNNLARELTPYWSEKFTENYISNALAELLKGAIFDPEINKTIAIINRFEGTLSSYNQEQIVYIPLINIWSVEEIEIGPIKLVNMTDIKVEEISTHIESIIMSSPGEKEQNQLVSEFIKIMVQGFEGSICAEYRIIAETDRARERAIEETRRVIDLIRYAIPAIYPTNVHVNVGLQGDAWPGTLVAPIISSDFSSFNWNQKEVGPLQPFVFSPQIIEILSNLGFFKLAEILKKPYANLTEFERSLLKGIHWFSSALTQVEPENKFLNLTTCLETFLTQGSGYPVVVTIAESVALIFSENSTERLSMRKKVKDLYGMRSGVSHGGHKAIYNNELNELQAIAFNLIKIMIGKLETFQTKQNIFDWVDELKFG